MLTMVHSNPARLENGVFQVDRKFHTGMQEYLKHLDVPILSIHPQLTRNQDGAVMDLVAVPEAELGYQVRTVGCSAPGTPLPGEVARLRRLIEGSQLVYGSGSGWGTQDMSVESGIPYVSVVEYNFRTDVVFAAAGTKGAIRRAWRGLKAAGRHVTDAIPSMRGAMLLHCNGYPIYNEAGWFNKRRLLYLDSRMRTSMLIGEADLRERLAARRTRIPRLLFSGRFESAKGALDVVKIAAESALQGVPCEFVIYGQGSQRAAMNRLVIDRGLSARVKIYDPIPYPQLMEVARACDMFVCCHIQDDPSCTYIESLGCGLPIVGYGNAMWRAMQLDSGAGLVTKLGSPGVTAQAIRTLLGDPATLDTLSVRARAFAAEHTFEQEFAHRMNSLKEILRTGNGHETGNSN